VSVFRKLCGLAQSSIGESVFENRPDRRRIAPMFARQPNDLELPIGWLSLGQPVMPGGARRFSGRRQPQMFGADPVDLGTGLILLRGQAQQIRSASRCFDSASRFGARCDPSATEIGVLMHAIVPVS
jgi:hypothetical protein